MEEYVTQYMENWPPGTHDVYGLYTTDMETFMEDDVDDNL